MRTVRMLVYPGASLLDLATTLHVFGAATTRSAQGSRTPAYDVALLSLAGGEVPASFGTALPTRAASPEQVDTFLVPGADQRPIEAALRQPALLALIAHQAQSAERIGAMGAGASLLTHAAATADSVRQRLAALPRVHGAETYAVLDSLWVSRGACASTDLALGMVERDLGRNAVEELARSLHINRATPASAPTAPSPIAPVLAWVASNLSEDLSTATLAARIGLSVRSLHRYFLVYTGATPAKYVERKRVDAVLIEVEAGQRSLDDIAAAYGFSSRAMMKRAFARNVGVTPAGFRRHARRLG